MYHHPEQLAFANCRYHSAVNMGFIVWESGQHFIARETNKTAPSFVLLPNIRDQKEVVSRDQNAPSCFAIKQRQDERKKGRGVCIRGAFTRPQIGNKRLKPGHGLDLQWLYNGYYVV